jgi:hypothetical protein
MKHNHRAHWSVALALDQLQASGGNRVVEGAALIRPQAAERCGRFDRRPWHCMLMPRAGHLRRIGKHRLFLCPHHLRGVTPGRLPARAVIQRQGLGMTQRGDLGGSALRGVGGVLGKIADPRMAPYVVPTKCRPP